MSVDAELKRISKLLATDEALISFIKKLVYSRITPDTFSDLKWLQTVVDLSVNEAIEKLEIKEMIVSAKKNCGHVPENIASEIPAQKTQGSEQGTEESSSNILPSFSESEPSILGGRGRQSHRLNKSKPDPNDVASTQVFRHRNENTVNSARTGGHIRQNTTEYESRPGSAKSQSGRRGGHGQGTSGAFSNIDFQQSTDHASDAVLDSDEIPDSDAVPDSDTIPDADADADAVPDTGDEGNDSELVSIDANNKRVHFKEQLEDVKMITNIRNELDPSERREMFHSHIDGDRANYCYQRQKENAEQAGFESWSEWVNSMSEEDLAKADKEAGEDFDELMNRDDDDRFDNSYNPYIWGDDDDPYDENSDEDYDYMYNTTVNNYPIDDDEPIMHASGFHMDSDSDSSSGGEVDTDEFELEVEEVHEADDDDW